VPGLIVKTHSSRLESCATRSAARSGCRGVLLRLLVSARATPGRRSWR
jgi:hypothetical protein